MIKKNNTGKVSMINRMMAVTIVVAMCLSAFGMVLPSSVVATKSTDTGLNEEFQYNLEVGAQWLAGNITTEFGDVPYSVTIMFSNQRTGENVVEIARNGSYRLALLNFTSGYEVGDEIYIEALENTGNGKINAGETTLVVTDADEMWADIVLIDPPLELPPPPEITPLDFNETEEDVEEPIEIIPAEPGTRKPSVIHNIVLADIFAPEGVFFENDTAPLDITLGSVGDNVGDTEYLANLSWAIDEIDSLKANASGHCVKILLQQTISKLENAIDKAVEDEYARSIGNVGVAVGLLKVVESKGVDTTHIMLGLTETVRKKVENIIFYGESIYGSDNRYVERAWLRYDDGLIKQENDQYVKAIVKYELALVTILVEHRYSVTADIINVKPDGSEELIDSLTFTRLGIGREETEVTSWRPDVGEENTIRVEITYTENEDEIVNTEDVGFWVIPEGEEVYIIRPGDELPETISSTIVFRDMDLIIGTSLGAFTEHLTLDDDTLIMESTQGDGTFQILIESDGILEAYADSNIEADNQMARYGFNVYGTLIVDYSTVKWMWGDGDLSQAGGIVIHPGATVEIRNDAEVSEGKTHNIYCTGGSAPVIRDSTITLAGTDGGGHGIVVEAGSRPIILGNTVTSNFDYGLLLNDNAESLYISGNTFDSNYEGIVSINSDALIRNNIITGNTFGVQVSGSAVPTIGKNTITSNVGGASDEGVGIYMHQSSPIITDNTIDSNRYGIYVHESSSPLIEDNPSISSNINTGIYIYKSNSAALTIQNNPDISLNNNGLYLYQSTGTIRINDIHDNTHDGIYLDQSSGVIEGNTINGHLSGKGIRAIESSPEIRSTSHTETIWTGSFTEIPLGPADSTEAADWADFDGDGDWDLIVGNYNGEQSYFYKNVGGAFQENPAFDSWNTGQIEWGRFDDDSYMDVALGNTAGQNYLYLYDPGTGGFISQPEFGGDWTTVMALADINGDGYDDVAVGNLGQQNYLYVSTGPGTFSGTAEFGIDNTNAMEWVDFDLDGDQDLAVGNVGGIDYLYRNNGGTFEPLTPFGASNTDTAALAWGYIDDSDEYIDIAIANYLTNEIRIYQNNGGAGTFTLVDILNSGGGTWALDWADFDQDGDWDIAVGNYYFDPGQPNYLFLNDGGTFTSQQLFGDGSTTVVKWGHYNDDRVMDLFSGNNGTSKQNYLYVADTIELVVSDEQHIYENDDGIYVSGATSAPEIHDNFIHDNVRYGISILQAASTIENNEIYGHTTDAGINVWYSSCLVSGNTVDNNNHGIYFDHSSATVNGNNMITNNQNGIYSWYCRGTDAPIITGNTITGNTNGVVSYHSEDVIYNNIQISGNTYGVVVDRSAPVIKDNSAFFDNTYGVYATSATPTIDGNTIAGNGIGEFGVYSSGVPSYSSTTLSNGASSNTFTITSPAGGIDASSELLMHEDVDMTSASLRMYGYYALSDPMHEITPTSLSFTNTTDYNGDGLDDVMASYSNGYIELFENTGAGSFISAYSSRVTTQWINAIASGDFDNDGDIDFVVGTGNGEILYLERVDPPTVDFIPYTIRSPDGNYIWSVTAGDFNEDGNCDFFAGIYAINGAFFYEGDGSGSFIQSKFIDTGSQVRCVKAINMDDSDDYPEILVTKSDEVYLYDYEPAPTDDFVYVDMLIDQWGEGIYYMAIGDYNSDSYPDVVVSSSYYQLSTTIDLCLNTQSGGFSKRTLYERGGVGSAHIVIGSSIDYDGDGDDELIGFGFPLGQMNQIYDIELPTDVGLDVGNDGSIEWQYSGGLSGSVLITDADVNPSFHQVLNNYLKTQGGDTYGRVTVPLGISSLTAGKLTVSNIQLYWNLEINGNTITTHTDYGIYNDETPTSIESNTVEQNANGLCIENTAGSSVPGTMVSEFSDGAIEKEIMIGKVKPSEIPTITIPKNVKILGASMIFTGLPYTGESLEAELYTTYDYGILTPEVGQEFFATSDYTLTKVEFYLVGIGEVEPYIIRVYNGDRTVLLSETTYTNTVDVGWTGTILTTPVPLTFGEKYFISILVGPSGAAVAGKKFNPDGNSNTNALNYIGGDWYGLGDEVDLFYRLYREYTNQYPLNPKFDINSDLSYEWAYGGIFDITETISDTNTNPQFTQALQSIIDGSPVDPVDIPLGLYGESGGIIRISNVKIFYSSAEGSVILHNDIYDNDNIGIILHDSSPDIYDNFIDSNYYIGIGVYDNSAPSICNNIIKRTPSATSWSFKGIDIGSSSAPSITHNRIEDQGLGIISMNSSPIITDNPQIDNNNFGIYCAESVVSIDNNVITNARGGISLSWDYPGVAGCSGIVSNNQITGGLQAIRQDKSAVDIIDNTISTGFGIIAYYPTAPITISGNVVTVTGDINPETGITTGGGPVTISGNTLTGSGRGEGIFVGNTAVPYSDVTINGQNVITGFDYGIDMRADSTVTIDGNVITGNDLDGIYTGGKMLGNYPIYTITNCEIYDNGGWGMNFIRNEPTNADTLESDNPDLGPNGMGKIHQEWEIVYVCGRVHPSGLPVVYNVPMHLTITEADGVTVIFDDDISECGWTSIPVIEYELLNTGGRIYHTDHTVEAESYGEYFSPLKTQIETMDSNRPLYIEFDLVEDSHTFLCTVPVPGFAAKNYISFPLVQPKVDSRPLDTVEDLWNEIVTAGGVPQEIRMWELGTGWIPYKPGDPVFDIMPDYAYEITHEQPFGMTITGYLPGYRQMDLYDGDNYIGWTTHHTEIRVSTFATLLEPQNLDIIYRWDTASQSWISMSPTDLLYPGKVYWVVVNGDCTLEYAEANLVDELP